MPDDKKRLRVRFYRTPAGDEPVREWLKALPPEERKIIGDDLKAAQYGWPLATPLISQLEVDVNETHLGSDLDDLLEEEGRLAEAEAVAAKRVLAFQIAKLMAEQQLSKAEMARRMSTSRAAVDRLLDSNIESATLATLEKAAAALGRRLHVALV